jgi:hypothetical protein
MLLDVQEPGCLRRDVRMTGQRVALCSCSSGTVLRAYARVVQATAEDGQHCYACYRHTAALCLAAVALQPLVSV